MYARSRGVTLAETIEYVWKKLGVNAHAVIRYNDFGMMFLLGQFDENLSAMGRKLDRICQQVPYNLLQAIGVSGDGAANRFQLQFYLNTFCVTRRPYRFNSCFDDSGQIDRFDVQP